LAFRLDSRPGAVRLSQLSWGESPYRFRRPLELALRGPLAFQVTIAAVSSPSSRPRLARS